MSVATNPLTALVSKTGVDPFLTTHSRARIYYGNVDPRYIRIRDIAFHLSHINRWVGSIGRFSVAQHSVLLAQHALDAYPSQFPEGLRDSDNLKKKTFAMALLMHDVEEYITNDIPGPLKLLVPALGEYGDYLRALIWRKYNIHEEWYPYCKIWDRRILFNEARWGGIGRDGVSPKLDEGIIASLDIRITGNWLPEIAETRFLEMFTDLS